MQTAGPGDVGKNIVIAAVTNLIPPLAAFATAPILARELGVVARGEVGAATAPLLLLVVIAGLGLPTALTVMVVKRPAIARLALLHASGLTALSGVIGMVTIYFLAQPLSGDDSDLARLIVTASFALVPTLIVALLRASASGQHLWSLVNREKIITAVVRLLSISVLALTGHLTVETAIASIALSPITGVLAYSRVHHHVPRENPETSHLQMSSSLLSFGSRVWIGSLSGILLSRLDQLLITPLAGVAALGLYITAVSVSEIALVVNNAVRDVMLSSDAATHDTKRLTAAARASFLVALVIAGSVCLSMWWWFPMLFGEEFRPAIPVAILLVLGGALGTPGSLAGAGLSARGRPGLRSMSLVVAVFVNVILVMALVPQFGAIGAALATLVGTLVSSALTAIFFCRFSRTPLRDLYFIRSSDFSLLFRTARRMFKIGN
jgi:O-antigen/teichoic acid export membrane protein